MNGIVSINITIVNASIRQARIHFKDEWFKELKIDRSRRVLIIYNNKENLETIVIKKANYRRIIQKIERENFFYNLELIRTIMLDKKLLFPKEFLRLFEKLDLKQNFKCNYYLEKGELKLTLPNTTKKNVILFKINKGGVGKTFLTSQVGVGLTLAEPNKKVLIITSDSQNNILNFLDKNDSDISNGLIKDVLYGKGEYIKLRKNLYFLPLENARFGKIFLEKLKEWLDFKRREYDYILIDR